MDYVEDIVRIIIDQVASNYGVRKCQVPGEIAELYNLYETQIDEITGQPLESKLITVANLDFSQLKNMNIDLNIDIGAKYYFGVKLHRYKQWTVYLTKEYLRTQYSI